MNYSTQGLRGNSQIEQRLQIKQLVNPAGVSEITGLDVVQGLTGTPKTLPPKYFYDDRGSELFEQICQLPEYYLTRTETEILRQFSPEIAQITGPCELIELGSGSSTKTRLLLDAYQALHEPLFYVPIDVSAGILETSAKELLTDYPSLQIQALVSTYEVALSNLSPSLFPARTICFLGSTLGNLNPSECQVFFSQIAAALETGDYFLLGVDLHKSKPILEAAYNDSQKVTAAFNLNILSHLKWRFQGDFQLQQFEHWSFYNETDHQIEMHLRSLTEQTIHLEALNLNIDFGKDETILTEISRKFDLESLQFDLQQYGLKTLQVWTDSQHWFGLILCQYQSL